jgi:hypothetical protein
MRDKPTMRSMTFGILAATALSVSACGSSGGTFANRPRPPAPVNLTVYVNNSRVSVSPSSVGAGPVVFIVTNAASETESLNIQFPGGSQDIATTGPINPQATAEVTVDFRHPGTYTVAASKPGENQASLLTPSGIQPATLHIGKPRPSGSNELLQP